MSDYIWFLVPSLVQNQTNSNVVQPAQHSLGKVASDAASWARWKERRWQTFIDVDTLVGRLVESVTWPTQEKKKIKQKWAW